MRDDVLDITSDVLEGIADRHVTNRRTKQILEIIALILGAASIICYFVWDRS